MDDKKQEEKTHKCEKCGKNKKESEGVWVLSGSTFCCRECCGDESKNNENEEKSNVCEFC